MIERLKQLLRISPLAPLFIRWKGRSVRPWSQNGEDRVLAKLAARYRVPELFVEFGFGGWEFNCAGLANSGWRGLLVDGDKYSVTVARTLFAGRVDAWRMWINLTSISQIRDWVAGRELGVLSIDVDGNDYWFLNALIDLRPAIVVIEYNTVLGLRSLTVPYRDDFDYRQSPNPFFAGASLAALAGLAERNGYQLVSQHASLNALFVRGDLLGTDDVFAPIEEIYDGALADKWIEVADLPFEKVPGPTRLTATRGSK